MDGVRSKLSKDARLVPDKIIGKLASVLGQDAFPIIEEMAITLQENKEQTPPLLSNLTVGENIDFYQYGVVDGKNSSYRPEDHISYDRIEDMMRNGQVLFGLEMKKSWVRSALRDDRSWDIECEDEHLKEIVTAIMNGVMQKHAGEFMEALPYGVYFGEKIFDRLPASYWGLDGDEKLVGYKKINSVYPRTVERIIYDNSGQHFDGYIQRTQFRGRRHVDEVVVKPELALVLTYDKKWRNLWGNSVLEATYPYWAWYEIAYRSWLRYLERMGTPVAVCYAPARGQIRGPDGALIRTMKYAFMVAGNVAKSNAIALPSDVDPDTNQKLWEVQYLVDDKRAAQFEMAVKALGTQIIRSLVIGDRMVEQPTGDTGSYASSQTHFAATMLHNEHVLLQFISQFNDFLIPQLVQYNGEQNSPRALMVTEGLDPEEKTRLFGLLNTMGNQADGHAMKFIDWEAIMRINNIPTLNEEDVKKIDDEALQRQEDQMKMASQFETPNLPGPGKSPDSKVKASADYVAYQLSNGMQPQILLSNEQAREFFDRLSDRPFVSVPLQASIDRELEQIVDEVMSQMGSLSDEEADAVREFILSELGLITMEAVELQGFLRDLFNKAKSFINKAVKKVTGKSVSEWIQKAQSAISGDEPSQAAAEIGTIGGGRWNPNLHPRDEKGRFAEVADTSEATGDEPPVSRFGKLENPDPSKGILGTISIDGFEYKIIGNDIDPVLMERIHETNKSIHEKSAELGYDLEPISISVFDMNDTSAVAKFLGVSEQDVEEYIAETGGFTAHYDSIEKTIVFDTMLAEDDIASFEAMLFHETLHGQPTSSGEQRNRWGPLGYDPEEIFATITSMNYSESSNLPVFNGYPIMTGWVTRAADILGWSKEKLYEYALDAHKTDGYNYDKLVTKILDAAGISEPWQERIYDPIIEEYWPGWESNWRSVAITYGLDPDKIVDHLKGN